MRTVHKKNFISGSLLKHVSSMLVTSSVSMIFFYFVDFLASFYLSKSSGTGSLAALGIAASSQFLLTSISMGIHIGCSTLVSRSVGANDDRSAHSIAAAGIVLTCASSALCISVFLMSVRWIFALLRIDDGVAEQAQQYLWVTAPANVFSGLGLLFSSLLRAHARPGFAMYAQISGPMAAAALDPLLIWYLDLGLHGAALTFLLSRAITTMVGGWLLSSEGLLRIADLRRNSPLEPMGRLLRITVPIIVANLSTPASMIYTSSAFAQFGSNAMAGATISDRIMQVAFSMLFIAPAAIGPIIGQNFGAKNFERTKLALFVAHLVLFAVAASIALLLFALAGPIADLFDCQGEARSIVIAFCRFGTFGWAIASVYYTTIAAMNPLGYAPWTILLSWLRSLAGVVLFAWIGARTGTAENIIYMQAVGSLVVAVAAGSLSWRLLRKLDVLRDAQVEVTPRDRVAVPAG